MSEAELHLIRARLDGGLRNKAQRGELELSLPVGLDRDEDGRIVLTADEQVRHALGRVFELWRRIGSARQVVSVLRDEGQRVPRRTVGVAARAVGVGDLWVRARVPDQPGICRSVRVRPHQPEEALDATGRVRRRTIDLPLEQWSVCLPEHHPGYVTWEEYLATRERLRQNVRPRGEGGGAAREGVALLQGIVRCGRCGRRMQVAYSGNDGQVPRYACVRAHQLHGTDSACQSLGATRLEKAVTAAFLEAITPAGVRACTEAIGELERQHEDRLTGQRLAVERAEFEAERARNASSTRASLSTASSRAHSNPGWRSRWRSSSANDASSPSSRPAALNRSPTAERRALTRLIRDLPPPLDRRHDDGP